MKSKVSQDILNELMEYHTRSNEMKALGKYRTGKTKKKPSVRQETIDLANRLINTLGAYSWQNNQNGFSFEGHSKTCELKVFEILKTRTAEIDIEDVREFCDSLPTQKHRRLFLYMLVKLLGPKMLLDTGTLDMIFSAGEPGDKSQESNPIRSFFGAFKTEDPEVAKTNCEVLQAIIENGLLAKTEPGSRIALKNCLKYVAYDVHELVPVFEAILDQLIKVEALIVHKPWQKVSKQEVHAIRNNLKLSYLENEFVTDDDKRKAHLLL